MVQPIQYKGTPVSYGKEIKGLVQYVEVSGFSEGGHADGGRE